MLSKFVVYFLYMFMVSLAVTNLFRFYLMIKNRKKEREFMGKIEGKLKELSGQIRERAGDLQETMDMISKEYNDVMETLAPPGPVRRLDTRGPLASKLKYAEEQRRKTSEKDAPNA